MIPHPCTVDLPMFVEDRTLTDLSTKYSQLSNLAARKSLQNDLASNSDTPRATSARVLHKLFQRFQPIMRQLLAVKRPPHDHPSHSKTKSISQMRSELKQFELGDIPTIARWNPDLTHPVDLVNTAMLDWFASPSSSSPSQARFIGLLSGLF